MNLPFPSLPSLQVVVGSVVTRSPNTTIAWSALEDLELAIRLFETSAAKSQRARVALVSV